MMKKLHLSLFLLLISAFSAFAQTSKQAIVEPDAQALAKIKAGKAYLIDVRTPEEFSTGHLQYATHIDYNAPGFKEKLAKLDKKKPVYLYCRSGNRSGKSTDSLAALGFKEYYNIGGFEKLKEKGFPAEPAVTAKK